MTYDELIKWAEAQGKTEADLIEYELWSDAASFWDTDIESIYEALKAGYVAPNKEVLKFRFEQRTEQQQQEYLFCVNEEWTTKS